MQDDYGNEIDLSQAEGLIDRLEDDKPEGEKGGNNESIEGEFIAADDIVKSQSRAIVGSLEGLFRLKDSRVSYGEELYEKGEKELSPAIAQYGMSNTLKHLVGLNAVIFIGSLVMTSIRAILVNRAADQEAAGGEKSPTEPT